jgi:hypothetical protein
MIVRWPSYPLYKPFPAYICQVDAAVTQAPFWLLLCVLTIGCPIGGQVRGEQYCPTRSGHALHRTANNIKIISAARSQEGEDGEVGA